MSGLTILDADVRAFVPLPPEHVEGYSVACPRVKVKAREYRGTTVLMAGGCIIPIKWIERLEQNQLLNGCCRHPENHDIQAYYSSPEYEAKGIPDIYVLHCTCGRRHRHFCVGGSNRETGEGMRIKWAVR